MPEQLFIKALKNIPMVQSGDDLADVIHSGLAASALKLEAGDILVLAQKIVSKSEGRTIDLNSVTPGARATAIGAEIDKDPRQVELILSESRSIVRKRPGLLIVEHNRGWIMANAGIDASNVKSDEGQENVLLLPTDPDASCRKLRDALGGQVGIVISDSFGRPWRLGTTGVAIGAAGVASLWDRRGETDLYGRELVVSQQAIADELAAAASLLQGQAAEGSPVVLIRGLDLGATAPDRPAADLLRPIEEDMFR